MAKYLPSLPAGPPDRHGVILVVNKRLSALFDGGGEGHQEATSSAVVSVAGSAGFLAAAGGGGGAFCPHLASVTVLPEKSILVPSPETQSSQSSEAPRPG